jgi:ABC-type transport system involved in multi-copper enzyme maturation permease subunit
VAEQKALIESCHARIVAKARSELDARQFAQFQTLDKEFVANTEGQIGEPAWNRTAPFYHWLIDFYFFIILPLSCVRSCGGLIRDELQNDTLGFLTTRPVKRATLVVLKYLSQAAWLEIVVLVEGLLLLGAGALREIPHLGALLPLFLAAQFLAVLAWSALGLFLGQVTKRYLPLALVYGLIVELGIGDIPTNINTLSLMRHLRTLLSHDAALQSLYEWTGTGVLLPVGALLLAAALFVALAALLFTFREYHAAAEMQK